MEKESFVLPGGKRPRAFALAMAVIPRDALAGREAQGREARSRAARSRVEPIWGLLYASDESLGFFVPPTEASLAILCLGKSAEINLEIPYPSIRSVEIRRRAELAVKGGVVGAMRRVARALRSLSARSEATCEIAWALAEGDKRLRFEIPRGIESLERELSALIGNRLILVSA